MPQSAYFEDGDLLGPSGHFDFDGTEFGGVNGSVSEREGEMVLKVTKSSSSRMFYSQGSCTLLNIDDRKVFCSCGVYLSKSSEHISVLFHLK